MVCVKSNGFAEENECDMKKKPETFKDCGTEELIDCGPKWHISEWTDVSVWDQYVFMWNNNFYYKVFKTMRTWISKAYHQMPRGW